MKYLWPKTTTMEGMHQGFGVMVNPNNWAVSRGIKEGRLFAVDNGAFSNGFNSIKFFGLLEKLRPYMNPCLFVVCPDKVGDARETMNLFEEWAPRVREYGPIAFVAQDGQEDLGFPEGFDWLFIGGSTDWKMGEGARICIERTNKPVHVGRVNSIKRFQYFQSLGCKSADGTKAIYHPGDAEKRITYAIKQLPLSNFVS